MSGEELCHTFNRRSELRGNFSSMKSTRRANEPTPARIQTRYRHPGKLVRTPLHFVGV
jgi:hypothetical protein